jgi:hypothetical protein
MTFYVYTYVIDDVPRYVGKGMGSRWKAHRKATSHLGRKLQQVKQSTNEWLTPIVVNCENEEAAKTEEKRLIALYGREDLGTGPLYNLTAGGDGTSGHRVTEATKQKIRSSMAQPETKKRIGSAVKIALADPETKQRMKTNSRAARASTEYRTARSRLASEIMQDVQIRGKIGQSVRKAMADEATKIKHAEATKTGMADPLVRLKCSNNAKRAMAKSEIREQIVATLRITNNKPEVRAKRSQSARKFSDNIIRAVYAEPGLHREVSEKFGVSKSHVAAIKRLNRQIYKDIILGEVR